MIYIIPILLLLTFLVIHSNKLLKTEKKKMLDELTEQLRLEEWQIRMLREYLRGC